MTRFFAVLSALFTAITGATAAAQTPGPTPLLTYEVSTSPDPLQVARTGSLHVVVGNSRDDVVRLESLIFTIEAGTTGRVLTRSGNGVTLSSSPGWDFGRDGDSFVASPRPPATALEITTQGLVFTLGNIAVDSAVGITRLIITERASTSSQVLDSRVAVVQLSKVPGSLTVGDLTASRPRVGYRDSVTLTWEGSDANYRIEYGGDTAWISSRQRAWTSPPLEQATTFILVANGQEANSTREEHLSVTVQVDTPSVRAHDLTVRDSSVLQGPVTAMAELRVGRDVKADGRMYDATGMVFPPGGIIMWAGRADQVPQGWVVCDGQNGTPDLRGRFVVGWHPSDPDYSTVGATGGAARVTLTEREMPAHTHEGSTGPAGSHDHEIAGTSAPGLRWGPRGYQGTTTVDIDLGGSNPDPQDQRLRGVVRTGKSADHVHSVTIGTAGGGQPHENRPPYYVLAYIMKL